MAKLDYMLIEINEQRRLKQTTEKYNELLMAVEKKYKTETRHETALRYIKKHERKAESGKDDKPNSQVNVIFSEILTTLSPEAK